MAATFTKVPESVTVKLGLKAQYEAEVELGDGRILKRRLALAEVEIEGVRRPVLFAIGGEGERALLGYTTLEILGFKVNPVTGKLEKTVAIEYLETMAGGTPVVCSNTSSLPEVAGDAALLVDPTDVRALMGAMEQVPADEHLRAELRARGLKGAKQFTWERAARETLEVYRQAMRGMSSGQSPL